MRVELKASHSRDWRFGAVLPSGQEVDVTVLERGRINRRESEYVVTVDDRQPWRAILLAMPNRRYAWRIDHNRHRKAGTGDYHSDPILALRDGVVPYVVTQEFRTQPPEGNDSN